MLARFFIDRPVLAWVISIVIILLGAIAAGFLPIAEYPEVSPPNQVKRKDWQPCPEAVCGGVGREKITVANGNHTIPGRSHRTGVTSDGAENAPRLRVLYGEASKEAEPPLEQPSRDTHGQRSG